MISKVRDFYHPLIPTKPKNPESRVVMTVSTSMIHLGHCFEVVSKGRAGLLRAKRPLVEFILLNRVNGELLKFFKVIDVMSKNISYAICQHN